MTAFAALMLLFTACRKDEDVSDIDLQIPGSEEVVKINALGLVTDIDGNPLPGTTVQLYERGGKLIGETQTNAQGRFEMEDVPATQQSFLVDAGKENYHHSTRLVTTTDDDLSNIHLKLAANTAFPGQVVFNPSDTTFLVLQGTIVDNSNFGVPSFAITLYQGEPYHIAVADEEGDFEVFAPVGETFNLMLFQACGGEFYNEELGPFFADQNLGNFTAPDVNIFLLNGTLLDCSGSPVSNGYAIVDWSNGVSTTAHTGPDGFFSVALFDCQTINPVITVTGYNLADNTVSDPVDVPFNSANMDAGTLTVCNQDVSSVTFELDGTSYTFQPFLAFVVEDSITNPSTGQTTFGEVTILIYNSTNGQNNVIVEVAGATPGTHFVRSLLLVIDGQSFSPLSSDPGVFDVDASFTVHDNVPNGIVEGSFNGTFVDFSGQRSVSGTFKARQQ